LVALPNAVDSGFFSSSLDALLVFLQARTLTFSGLATDICVLFTANAYMRGYTLVVPEDYVAAETAEASPQGNHVSVDGPSPAGACRPACLVT